MSEALEEMVAGVENGSFLISLLTGKVSCGFLSGDLSAAGSAVSLIGLSTRGP